MFWTSRFICFRLRFLYIRLRIQNIRLRIQNTRLRLQNCRLRLKYYCSYFCPQRNAIAFSELNLFARFNHPKYVHTKIKLISKLGFWCRVLPICKQPTKYWDKHTTNYYENSCLWVYEHIYCISVKNFLSSKSLPKYMSIWLLSGMNVPI